MKSQDEKEKLVRDLVNTYNDRDELHIAYKERMKSIFFAFFEFMSEKNENLSLEEWIDSFVEERFKPEE